MHSTSTSAFFGKVFTAIAERAGKGSLKNSAYTSFMAAKSFMSERNTVVFITFPSPMPASSRIAFAFVSDCLVCSLMPPGANSPVAGSMGSCPEVMISPFASIAWLYGPMALGALFVFTTFIILVL